MDKEKILLILLNASLLAIIVLLLIILATRKGVERVVVFETKTDTLLVAAPPDTVLIEKIKIVKDTVFSRPDTVLVVEERRQFISQKSWSGDFWKFGVSAYAPAPVDSFRGSVEIDWLSHYESVIKPTLQPAKRRWYESRTFGFITGVATAVAVAKYVK